jgi:hypothetical protein
LRKILLARKGNYGCVYGGGVIDTLLYEKGKSKTHFFFYDYGKRYGKGK